MIEFKVPSEKDVEDMKEFAGVIESGMKLIDSPAMSHVSHTVAKKLQEALMWFSHGVLNRAEEVIAATESVVEPIEGELIQAENTAS